MRLILFFVFMPLIELFLLLELAELISGINTFALVIFTGVIGASLARHQGFGVIQRLQAETQQGRLPTTTLVDALMIFVAGALLITPGILTDIFGFSLLIPVCRSVYRRWITAWLKKRVRVEGVRMDGFTQGTAENSHSRDEVIDSYVIESSTPKQDP